VITENNKSDYKKIKECIGRKEINAGAAVEKRGKTY
jgi:hypothetical protein